VQSLRSDVFATIGTDHALDGHLAWVVASLS
jgi:hypothetical protein